MDMFFTSSISSQVIHCQASSLEPLGNDLKDFCGRTVTPHKACPAFLPLLQWKHVFHPFSSCLLHTGLPSPISVEQPFLQFLPHSKSFYLRPHLLPFLT